MRGSAVRGIGLDFGTTNSALAIAEPSATRVVEFASAAGPTSAFRSVLFFGREDPRGPVESAAGPRAIERYLELDEDRRLIQSLKSFLASRLFSSTSIYGRSASLEQLIAQIVRALVDALPDRRDALAGPVVVGRPVRFARAESREDDAFAVSRLERALADAGVANVAFEFEPVAAAYHYEQSLDRDELVLIADFGGGTSDFCLLPVGPSRCGRPRTPDDILGTDGIAVAGDAFDARIVRHVVAPNLGRGSRYRPPLGQVVAIPNWIYGELERWHHLSFLKSRKTMGFLHDALQGALEPEKLRALIHVVECNLGFRLYRSVERTKTELSRATESTFIFDEAPATIETRVTRSDFESWIAREVEQIAGCVDRLLAKTGVAAESVDRVFLTGGSAFVPAVRGIFEERFGPSRLRGGDELVSVASGLALRARDLASEPVRR